jgi:hypothetical protein
MPMQRTLGHRRFTPASTKEASKSPEASPATMPKVFNVADIDIS